MSILLETTFGDLIIDLDIDGSPALSKNILKLTKARYYTNSLVYNVVPGRYCQLGDPRGDGTGGTSIHGLIDSTKSQSDIAQSQHRFLQSHGRFLSPSELDAKGVVIAMEMGNVKHTVGSQFLITLSEGNGLKDMISMDDKANGRSESENKGRYLSLGRVVEDSQDVLSKLNRAYCDDDGRPFADIRIQRALVIHDPFEDPPEMEELLKSRGVDLDGIDQSDKNFDGYPLAPQSPSYDRPPEEIVPLRIQADDTTLFANEYRDESDEDEETKQKRLEMQQRQEEEWKQRQDTSRAVMLEMLGDLPSAEIRAPENVLFVCKLNPLTNDEDLELIFSRFDQTAKAEIIRDPDTGDSLQYAFVEFASNEACNEAYLKMNNALVDDRRIRVDFSQSVAKVWDRYHKRYRRGLSGGVDLGYADGGGRGGGGRGRGRGRGGMESRGRGNHSYHARQPPKHYNYDADRNRDISANRGNPRSPSPEKRHSTNRSRSPSREAERNKRRSRSYSSDSAGNRKRRRHKHRRSSSSSRSSSASRGRKHKKKHSRRHDHKHHSRREKKRRKKHRHKSRDYSDESRERSRDRSASPRPRGKTGDDSYSRQKREDESDFVRSEGLGSHSERKHHHRRH